MESTTGAVAEAFGAAAEEAGAGGAVGAATEAFFSRTERSAIATAEAEARDMEWREEPATTEPKAEGIRLKARGGGGSIWLFFLLLPPPMPRKRAFRPLGRASTCSSSCSSCGWGRGCVTACVWGGNVCVFMGGMWMHLQALGARLLLLLLLLL